MLNTLALALVLLAGLYFVALAAASLLLPARAAGFLQAFASSASAHYLELVLRLVAGTAFVLQAPRMRFADAFALFGWLLIVTTVCLAAIPWHWHRRFAQRVMPSIVRHLTLIGVVSLVLGTLVLAAAVRGET